MTLIETPTLAQLAARLSELEGEVADLRQRLEKAEIAAAMKKSIAQMERGECVPAVDFVKAMGRKYGITK